MSPRLQGCWVSDPELNRLVTYWQRARRSATITPETEALAGPAAAPPSPEPAPTVVSTRRLSPPPVAPAVEAETPPPPPKKSKKSAAPKKKEEPVQQPLWEALQEEAEKPEYSDELMPEAIALVRKLNKASTSLLQRRFRIGYTRAARMIDAMEEMGIIGPPTGTSKAREVYPPPEANGESAAEVAPNPPEEADQLTAGS